MKADVWRIDPDEHLRSERRQLTDDILKLSLHVRAEMALKEAVREALAEHARERRPACALRGAKVVAIDGRNPCCPCSQRSCQGGE